MRPLSLGLIAAAATLASSGSAEAAQLALGATSIIGANSVYSAGTNNSGGSPFARVTAAQPQSQRVTDTYGVGKIFDSPTGAVTENGAGNYWISGDDFYYPGAAQAYITLDLGSMFDLSSFELFNTHNSGFNDRGTGGFQILGSNEIATDGSNGMTLAGTIATLASGTLASESSSNAFLTGQSFASATGSYRYLQFRATSVAAAGTAVKPSSGGASIAHGLNELRVFGDAAVTTIPAAVPEPASWAMMVGGFGLLGGALRRTRRTEARLA